jgi:5'(3')-deoxyribonucleotidase
MNKLTIFLDMDGVLANFEKAASLIPDVKRPDLHLDFSTFEPMPGAIDAVEKLIDMGHDVYIATTPPWDNPSAWAQKRDWVVTWLPQLKRKMFLTHHKNLLKGDILIDDTTYRGQKDFEGKFIHFGIGNNKMNWIQITDVIQQMTNMLNIINK